MTWIYWKTADRFYSKWIESIRAEGVRYNRMQETLVTLVTLVTNKFMKLDTTVL